MRFFLAVLTVAAIGLVALGVIYILPGLSFIAAFCFFLSMKKCETDKLDKEYQDYIDNGKFMEGRLRQKYHEDVEEYKNFEKTKIPEWFDQEKYAKELMIYSHCLGNSSFFGELHQWSEGGKATPSRGEYHANNYGLPTQKRFEPLRNYFKTPEDLCIFFEIFSEIEIDEAERGVGEIIMAMYKTNPHDEEIQKYIQHFHNDLMSNTKTCRVPFAAHKYLLPISENDIKCKFVSKEEFAPNSRAMIEAHSDKICSVAYLIIGIVSTVISIMYNISVS